MFAPLSLNLIIFSSAILLGAGFTALSIRSASRAGFLDYPTERKRHAKPTPCLGGVALFFAFWSVILAGLFMAQALGREARYMSSPLLSGAIALTPKIAGIFAGSLIILFTGLLDDKYRLNPLQKLAGQVVATLILMWLGLTINLVAGLGVAGYVITFLWIILVMNAFNFIDSLDGHCAGVALISAAAFFWITQIINQPMVGFFLIAFVGTLAGFLGYNFKPARTFLGDNGSLFIGYMMAAFTLLCTYQSPDLLYVTVFIPALIFGVPIYDTLTVIAVRLRRGIAPWQGDRNHFAHRLVKMGMSDRAAVIFSYFISATIGLLAVLTTQVTLFGSVLIGMIFVSILGVIAFLEFYAAKRERVIESLAKRKRRRKEDIREMEEGGSS